VQEIAGTHTKEKAMAFDVSKCDCCGECLERCHYAEYTREQVAEEVKALTEGKEARILDECVTCWACNTYCPTGANPADLILLRMEEKGYECTQALTRVVETHDSPQMAPSSVKTGEPGKPFISACTFHDIIPHLYEGQLFEGATFLLGGDYETMLVWEHISRPTTFKNGLAKKIENIAKTVGENEVIFTHDDCYATVTTKAEEYEINVPFKPVHQAEYYRDYLKEHEDRITKLNLKIAYHLPCATH
jgi:Fe-S oxidoreductase